MAEPRPASVLAVLNLDGAGPGVFRDEAAERGVVIEEWCALRDPVPAGRWDGVLILGGTVQVDEQERHAWIGDVLRVIERALDASVPTLGVCLGAQMLALAAGGLVGPAIRPEIGWHRVHLRPEAAHDPLLAFLGSDFVVFQGHSYAFTVPPGAIGLAFTEVCEQAYRVGNTAWGVQFHAEPTLAMMERWIAAEPLAQDRPALIAESRRRAAQAASTGRGLFGRFLDIVHDAPPAQLVLQPRT